MKLFPAVDILDRQAVRLVKGKRENRTIYGNAYDFAHKISNMGATNLHVVDLNGAFDDSQVNHIEIKQISSIDDLSIEVGGGIKSYEKAKYYLDELNVDRIVLGTVCVTNIDLVKRLVEEYSAKRIVAGVDCIDGIVKTHGWEKGDGILADDLIHNLVDIGIKRIIFTDISNDGTLNGLNLKESKRLQDKFKIEIIASGGLSSVDEIKTAKEMGVFGVIIGKSFYDGKLDLEEALKLEE